MHIRDMISWTIHDKAYFQLKLRFEVIFGEYVSECIESSIINLLKNCHESISNRAQ